MGVLKHYQCQKKHLVKKFKKEMDNFFVKVRDFFQNIWPQIQCPLGIALDISLRTPH